MDKNTTEREVEILIEKSQSGDVDAFGQLVRHNQAWLRGWLRSQLRDWTAADDLAQDTFVTAFKKIKTYRGDGNFSSWIRSIAHNHFRNYIRKHREEYIGGNEEIQHLLVTEDPQQDFDLGGRSQALRICLDKLKGPSCALIEARYLHGKSVREIAKEEDTGYSTMTMKLHRLRKTLAACVETKLNSEQA